MSQKSFFILSLSISCLLGGCGESKENTRSEQNVSVYSFNPVGDTDVMSTSHTSTIEEGKSVNLAFKLGGQIKRLAASEGDYVKKGQVIAYLDDVDYELQLRQLQTQYDQVSSELSRIEEMHRLNNVAENDYEKATSGLQQLKIQLEMTRNQLSYTRLVSPVSGYVTECYMEEGEMTGAGTPVFKIVDNSSLEADVALSASAYSMKNEIIKCIGRSTVTGNEEIPLEIISFVPDGDSNSLFKLRLNVPDSYRGRLLPGMNINVEITYESGVDGTARKIPSRAIFERQGKTYVWTIDPAESTLSERPVTVIGVPDGKYTLVDGFDGNDVIVAVGVHHLHEGQKVTVIGSIDNLKDKAQL